MSDSDESTLEQKLAEFIVPQTDRPLGSGGTTFALEATETQFKVAISCGFPMDSIRDELAMHLNDALAPLQLGRPVTLSFSWRVAAHAVQPGVKALPGIRNILAIASGKGGVGKSTVAANVALALARAGARVGILDADVYGPSQPRILGLMGQRPETRDGKMLLPLSALGVSVMSIGFLVDEGQAVAWRGPMVTSALNQMLTQTDWGELDYLVVDMPPGTGDIQLTLAQKVPVSGAVIVTTPQNIALSDARKGIDLFRKMSLPVLGIVENMAIHICGECGHEERLFGNGGGAVLAGEYDLPLLGSLPLQGSISEQTDNGNPTVAADPECAAGRLFRDTALRIAGELAAAGRDYSHLFPKVTVEAKP